MPNSQIELEEVSCDLCAGKANSVFIQPLSSIPADLGAFKVVKCLSCGLLYTSPRPSRASLAEVYSRYFGVNAKVNEASESSFKAFVKQNHILSNLWYGSLRSLWHDFCGQYLSEVLRKAQGKVLEIGCGRGDFLVELGRKGCDPLGVEINPRSVEACLKKGLKVIQGNFEDIDFPADYFDTIIMWHCLEHLPSPRSALEKAWRILKPQGRVFILSPNAGSYLSRLFGAYWCHWSIPFHLYHFTPQSIGSLAALCNYEIRKISTATAEYDVAHSLRVYLGGKAGKVLEFIFPARIFHTLPFRIMLAFVFRLVDLCLPGAGESLKVELRKSA